MWRKGERKNFILTGTEGKQGNESRYYEKIPKKKKKGWKKEIVQKDK